LLRSENFNHDVEVAKGLLYGKTPGEIVQDFGKVDPELLKSIKKAYDDPEAFKLVLDGVKYAQVSPGRDIARIMNKPMKNSPNYISSQTKNVSGFIDFMYQIVVDPCPFVDHRVVVNRLKKLTFNEIECLIN
jgi:hypothetical protein